MIERGAEIVNCVCENRPPFLAVRTLPFPDANDEGLDVRQLRRNGVHPGVVGIAVDELLHRSLERTKVKIGPLEFHPGAVEGGHYSCAMTPTGRSTSPPSCTAMSGCRRSRQ